MSSKVIGIRVPDYVLENLEKSKTKPLKALTLGALIASMHPTWDIYELDLQEDELLKEQRLIFARELEIMAQDNRNLKALLSVFKHLIK